MNVPDDELFKMRGVFHYKYQDRYQGSHHALKSVVCAACGEMVIERNARVQDGSVLCIPCAGLN
jgi:formylmethanofuran dehydrogenase subunit E